MNCSEHPERVRNEFDKDEFKNLLKGHTNLVIETCSISRSVLSDYCTGKVKNPPGDKIGMILDCLQENGVDVPSIDYLYGRTAVRTIDLTVREISERLGISEEVIGILDTFKDPDLSGFINEVIPIVYRNISTCYHNIKKYRQAEDDLLPRQGQTREEAQVQAEKAMEPDVLEEKYGWTVLKPYEAVRFFSESITREIYYCLTKPKEVKKLIIEKENHLRKAKEARKEKSVK